eukprot:sb/3473503/
MTTMYDFHGWHNLRGVEVEDGSGINMDGFLLHDNFIANMEVHKCLEGSFEKGNTRMSNSVLLSKTASSDGLSLGYAGDFSCSMGVGVPSRGSWTVDNAEFHDFTSCPVFEGCVGCRKFNSKLGGKQMEQWDTLYIVTGCELTLLPNNRFP